MAKRTKRPKRVTDPDALADMALSGAMRAAELADQADRESSWAEQLSKTRPADMVRVNVRLDADTARWISMAAAWERRRPRDVIADGVRLYLQRFPPPGYQEQSGKDLSADAALNLARSLKAEGQTHKAIAAELNRQGFKTATGQTWTPVNVQQRLRTRRA